MIDLTPGKFDETVLQAQTPVLLYITATWCGPCKVLRPIIEKIDAELGGKVSIVRMDSDLNRETVKELGVHGVPTLILFKEGKKVNSLVGLATKDKILAFIGE